MLEERVAGQKAFLGPQRKTKGQGLWSMALQIAPVGMYPC